MSDSTSPSQWTVRIAYYFVNLCFYLCWIAGAFVLMILLAYSFGFSFSHLTVQTPVAVELAPDFATESAEFAARPYVLSIEGMAKVRVEDQHQALNLIRFSIALVLLMAFAWANHQLRLVLRSVREGRPFDEGNSGRIRRMSYVVMAWEPALAIGHQLSNYTLAGLSIGGNQVVAANLHSGRLVVTGLVLFVLAGVFEAGVRLKRENDLTI